MKKPPRMMREGVIRQLGLEVVLTGRMGPLVRLVAMFMIPERRLAFL
jgi:hypothetical protein